MTVSNAMREAILATMAIARKNFDGKDGAFARKMGLNATEYSQAKNGKEVLTTAKWVHLARLLNVPMNQRAWNLAKTDVYLQIEEDVMFCKAYSKAFMLVDDTGIGKTFSLKHLSRILPNCFYIDCRQTPLKREFVRAIARSIGVSDKGTYTVMREDIKYALKMMPNPTFLLDEFGALEDLSVQFWLELWNDTEGACGWYLAGADGLRAKVEGHINRSRVGWAELFSRCNERYNRVTPTDKEERKLFYKKLITDVLSVNMDDTKQIPAIVNQCLKNDSGRISGLRRAETLKILYESK